MFSLVRRCASVYVADRLNNRIQVFKTDGTFVKEGLTQHRGRLERHSYAAETQGKPVQKFLFKGVS